MAAIKYQNITFWNARGKLEGPRIKAFLDSNNIDYRDGGKLDSDSANTQIGILSDYYGGTLSFPACTYEAVYYENGSLKVANNEFSTTVDAFPSNFANVAVKTS